MAAILLLQTSLLAAALAVASSELESESFLEPPVAVAFRSPLEAFEAYRLAFESGEWDAAVRAMSPGYRKMFTYEVLHCAGFMTEGGKRVFQIFADHGVDVEELFEQVEAINAIVDLILSRSSDVNAMLSQSIPIVIPGAVELRYAPGLTSLVVQGDRARATAMVIFVSQGPRGPTTHRHPEVVYFRKYNGSWSFCHKSEWKDADHVVVIE